MAAKLIIRVHPDDRVDVKVEGLTAVDLAKPPEKRLCRRVSERLEKDLGVVQQRVDAEAPATGVLLTEDTPLQLGNQP